MKSAVFITAGYPSPARPNTFAFVQEIVHAFARKGYKCTVVNPMAFYLAWNRKLFPRHSIETESGFADVDVYRPLYFSTRNLEFPAWGVLNPRRWRLWFFRHRALTLVKKLKLRPDVVYGHFVFDGGSAAMDIGRALDVPVIVGVGEENLNTSARGLLDDQMIQKCREQVKCYFPNSNHLARALKDLLGIPDDKILMLPNGVDHSKFKPLDKKTCRRRFNIDENAFVVGGVGDFIYRKGLDRVAAAISGLKGVVGIFAGRPGANPPAGDNVLMAKTLSHAELPAFLSACDVFALPTLSEGCCNAIIEAMSCGLPVVTSDLECVSDLVNESCALTVDPLDVGAIRDAVCRLHNDAALCGHLARGAVTQAESFDVDVRIGRMIQCL